MDDSSDGVAPAFFVEVEEDTSPGFGGFGGGFGGQGINPRQKPYLDEPPAFGGSRAVSAIGRGAATPQRPQFSGGGGLGFGADHDRSAQFSAAGARGEFEVVKPQLPGGINSPHAAKRVGFQEEELLHPKFGSLLPVEEFQDGEFEKEFESVIAEFSGQPKKKEAQPEFVAKTEGDADDSKAFAPATAAKNQQQKKALKETEETLGQIVSKAEELEKELEAEEDKNQKLRKEVKAIKSQLVELEDKVDDLRRESEAKGQVKAANADEAKKFRELEARMKREEAKRKAMELGLDYEDDDAGVDLALDRFGILKKIGQYYKKAKAWFHKNDKLYRSSRKAQSRFGGGVALYFWMFRWMIWVLAIVAFLWFCFFTAHFIDFPIRQKPFGLIVGLPRPLFYTSMDWAVGYASCIGATMFLLVVSAGYKFVSEYRAKHENEVINLDQEPARYAKLAFTAWDWATTEKAAADDQYEGILSNFKNLKLEDALADTIRKRTPQEWNKLYTNRAIGLTINGLLLLAGWGGIIFTKLFLTGQGGLIGFLPIIVPTAINGVLPVVTNMLVDFEKWDSPTFRLQMKVGRLYAAKILNALIQVAVILVLYRGPVPSIGLPRILRRDCNYASCEDQAGIAFFQLYVVDVIAAIISGIAFPVVYWKGSERKIPGLVKLEFQPPNQFIKILYQQILMWMTLPHFPFVLVVAFGLWYLEFVADAWVLFNYNIKPVKPFDAKDSGVYFATFYSFTLFIFTAWMYYIFFELFTNELDPSCCQLQAVILAGNSTDNLCMASSTLSVSRNGVTETVDATVTTCLEKANQVNGFTTTAPTMFQTSAMAVYLRNTMQSSDGFSSGLSVVLNTSLLGWFVVLLAVLLFAYEQMRVRILEQYLGQKLTELRNQQDKLDKQIKRKEQRIELAQRKED